MLGSFGTSVGNGAVGGFYNVPRSEVSREKAKGQNPNHLIETDWEELPYTMMRITGARRPWDNNRVYWRDRTVNLGDVDLHLTRTRADNAPSYTAVYTRDELRRDFILLPLLEGNELRWTAPGISETHLTTNQLAEKLLGKLVTFYATSGSSTAATSSASPGLSS